jgi:hypothetical protein
MDICLENIASRKRRFQNNFYNIMFLKLTPLHVVPLSFADLPVQWIRFTPHGRAWALYSLARSRNGHVMLLFVLRAYKISVKRAHLVLVTLKLDYFVWEGIQLLISIVLIYLFIHKFKNMNRWMYFVSSQLYVYEKL